MTTRRKIALFGGGTCVLLTLTGLVLEIAEGDTAPISGILVLVVAIGVTVLGLMPEKPR